MGTFIEYVYELRVLKSLKKILLHGWIFTKSNFGSSNFNSSQCYNYTFNILMLCKFILNKMLAPWKLTITWNSQGGTSWSRTQTRPSMLGFIYLVLFALESSCQTVLRTETLMPYLGIFHCGWLGPGDDPKQRN